MTHDPLRPGRHSALLVEACPDDPEQAPWPALGTSSTSAARAEQVIRAQLDLGWARCGQALARGEDCRTWLEELAELALLLSRAEDRPDGAQKTSLSPN